MTNIKNIILDYGNVIHNIDFSLAQHAFAGLGVPDAKDFVGHSGQSPIFDAFDKGQITAGQFRDQVRLAAGNQQLTDEEVNAAWTSMLLDLQPGVHQLLLKLKARYRTFLLSNINAIHYDHIMDQLKREYNLDGNEEFFEKLYYSHLVGMRKPDAAIFEFVLHDSNLNPTETLFIDDSPQHLATAHNLGLHTFLIKAPDTLQAFIERENLLD